MKLYEALKAELTQRVIMHTAQAIGGVLTATAVDLPALSEGRLTVDSFSRLAAGVIVQTATVAGAQLMAKWRERQAIAKATQAPK